MTTNKNSLVLTGTIYRIETSILFNKKYLTKLYKTLKEHNRNIADVSEKKERLLKILRDMTASAFLSNSLRSGITSVTICLDFLVTSNKYRIKQVQDNVLTELKPYQKLYNHVKKEAKQARQICLNQYSSRRELNRLRDHTPKDGYRIHKAEIKYTNDSKQMTSVVTNLHEKITYLEGQKNHSVKKSLMAFMQSEIAYHAQSIQALSCAYKSLEQVEEESDLQEFLKKIKIPKWVSHQDEIGKEPIKAEVNSSTHTSPEKKVPNQHIPIVYDLDSEASSHTSYEICGPNHGRLYPVGSHY